MKYKHSKLSNAFRGIKTRCFNSKTPNYKDYGGRGITLCPEWNDRKRIIVNGVRATKGWVAIREWAINNGYKEGLSIDRIDVNGDYSPSNCRWVSMKEQDNNKRSNRMITYKGETKTMAQWCDELGLDYKRIKDRISKYHWSAKRAFETKDNATFQMITYMGKTQCLTDWCRELKLNYGSTWYRIFHNGWSVEKAFTQPIRAKKRSKHEPYRVY